MYLGINHDAYQFFETNSMLPPQPFSRFARVSQQAVNFRRAIIQWIDNHVIAPIKIQLAKGSGCEIRKNAKRSRIC